MSAIATRPEAGQAGLHDVSLVRLLADLGATGGPAPTGPSFAARLGSWLNWTDAIALSAVLATPVPSATSAATASAPAAAAQALATLRADITRSISTDPIFHPSPAAPAPTDLMPYRLRHTAHQRSMGSRIDTVRAQLRQTMAAGSPALAHLAAIDAVLDDGLAQRERTQLAVVPSLLARRQAQLQQQRPDDWQDSFGRELQAVLFAELDLRLQPTLGLLAAMAQTVTASAKTDMPQPDSETP